MFDLTITEMNDVYGGECERFDGGRWLACEIGYSVVFAYDYWTS
jgi:hypothetical protein